MAEFRKLFYALGLAALLAGVSTTAKAQGISCSVGAGSVPTVVRSESFADLVGDYVLDCVGGVPTTPGAIVPSVNVSLTLSTNITSKILDNSSHSGAVAAGGAFTEALLIIDEPNVAPNAARPLLACGDAAAPENPNGVGVCQITAPTDPNQTYNGLGNQYGDLTCDGVDPDGTGPLPNRPTANQFGCGRPNVFQGRQGLAQNAGNTNIMLFNGVPFNAPGAIPAGVADNGRVGHRILRITNIRANSPQIAGGFLLAEITASINITGIANISIQQPTQRVANVAIGLQSVSAGTPNVFVQCKAETKTSSVRFREGFPSSFKPKGVEQEIVNGQLLNVLRYNGTTSSYGSGTINQNVPGANYFTESGFLSVSALANPSPNPPNGVSTAIASTGGTALNNQTNINSAEQSYEHKDRLKRVKSDITVVLVGIEHQEQDPRQRHESVTQRIDDVVFDLRCLWLRRSGWGAIHLRAARRAKSPLCFGATFGAKCHLSTVAGFRNSVARCEPFPRSWSNPPRHRPPRSCSRSPETVPLGERRYPRATACKSRETPP